ncbi:unnamed protein product [Pleuronectes platessa]|uniref:Uncharacterized protein n=1 Tax=Pleuronectes platessa TaxID=8262 RepID=A0A9N7VP01_PLEPL|nr:unnamed protein product [Pleuronectes platessa]
MDSGRIQDGRASLTLTHGGDSSTGSCGRVTQTNQQLPSHEGPGNATQAERGRSRSPAEQPENIMIVRLKAFSHFDRQTAAERGSIVCPAQRWSNPPPPWRDTLLPTS